MADTLAQIRVGSEHHGQRMSFEEFQRAAAVDGRLYELHRGVIEATDVPRRIHALMIAAIDEQLMPYRVANPRVIRFCGGGAEAKLELPGMESERHPDRSLYLTPMPIDAYPWDK